MGKLVSIEKIEDGKTKITITRMPKTTNHYKILLRECRGACHYVDNVCDETLVGAVSYHDRDKHKRDYWHIHLSCENDNARYEVILANTQWVRKHSKDIISQILIQEEQILVNSAIKRQVKNVTQAVKTGNYVPLIQQMIIDNASNLTIEDLGEIKLTLQQVEQEHKTIENEKL